MSHLIVPEMKGVYSLKTRFQHLLRPFVRTLAGMGIRANQITLFAGLLSVACGVLLLTSPDVRLFALLPAVLLVRMALNAADGMIAREFGQQTKLGVYLNEMTDVVADIFLYLPFAHLRGCSPFWIWNVVVLSVLTEMAGTVAVIAGASRRYDGPMGKADRAVTIGALGLWVGLTGGLPSAMASVFPKVMVVLLVLTVVNRVRMGLREKREYAAM
jgi:CDP-diacylglycerol--glycerol-3-phosphate 3-phosphatidyltransferase